MSVSLPLIVGYGGYNAAGRSSSHQAFRRMILESLPQNQQQQTIVSLACLMGLVKVTDQGFETADAQTFGVEALVSTIGVVCNLAVDTS